MGRNENPKREKIAVHFWEKNFYRIDQIEGWRCNETTTCAYNREHHQKILFGIAFSRDRVGKKKLFRASFSLHTKKKLKF